MAGTAKFGAMRRRLQRTTGGTALVPLVSAAGLLAPREIRLRPARLGKCSSSPQKVLQTAQSVRQPDWEQSDPTEAAELQLGSCSAREQLGNGTAQLCSALSCMGRLGW